jgi:hypothetical protein
VARVRVRIDGRIFDISAAGQKATLLTSWGIRFSHHGIGAGSFQGPPASPAFRLTGDGMHQ